MLSALGGHIARGAYFGHNSTVPIGDVGAPFAGLAFVRAQELPILCSGQHRISLLLVLGLTSDELARCRSHGTPHVVALRRAAGDFPFSDPERGNVPGLEKAGIAVLERFDDLPYEVEDVVQNAVNGRAAVSDVEHDDVPILAAAFDAFISLEQRAAIVTSTCELDHPELDRIRRDYVVQASREYVGVGSVELLALAHALASLGDDYEDVDTYDRNHELALETARRFAEMSKP